MTWQSLLVEIAWKGTAILVCAFAVNVLLRRAAASVRHFVWTATFVALLALPVISRVMPKWSAPIAPSFAAGYSIDVEPVGHEGKPSSAPTPTNWPVVLWIGGCVAAGLYFLSGAVRMAWICRRATRAELADVDALARELGIRRSVRVLSSGEIAVPLTWGVLRPVVLLPSNASAWNEARLTTVLLHEMMHIRRFDVLAQSIAQVACCFYWFHPAAWFGMRRLRQERERACDDAVLLRGAAPHEYAGHLMELVRAAGARQSIAPAMAEFSDLESRIRSLLDRGTNRKPVTRRAALAMASVACALLLSIAAITARAQPARGSLIGAVQDPSGAFVPNCQVMARNLDSTNQETTACQANGEYRFASIPAGRYQVEVSVRGFQISRMEATVVSGATLRADARLMIGDVSESVSVRGQRTAPVPNAQTPQRIRIGGNVQMTKLIYQPRPEYPADLQAAGVQGSVVMKAVISKTGELLNLQVLNTDVNPRLAQAAKDAASKWRYMPTLLNGEPVEVVTTITIDFTLE